MNFREKIQVSYVAILNAHDAANWLQENFDPAAAGQPDWEAGNSKPVIEFLLYRRRDKVLSLALARFGSSTPVLTKIYNSGDKVLQLAVLSNPYVNPWSLIREKGPVRGDQIVDILKQFPATRDHIDALFSNENISRDLVEKIFDRDADKEGQFAFLDDEVMLYLVHVITKNKVITEQHDDTYLDGYAEYRHNRLPLALLFLCQKVEPNQHWGWVLTELLAKLHVPFIPEEFDAEIETIFEKWRIDDVNRDPENKFDKPEGRGSFNFRRALSGLLLVHSHTANKDLVSADASDKAIRLGFFSSCRPIELVGSHAALNDSEKVHEICEGYFKRDGNDFVEALIDNENFWQRETMRRLLHDLAWHMAEDPNYYMDVPNLFRGREEYYRKEKPAYFADEDDWMNENEDSASGMDTNDIVLGADDDLRSAVSALNLRLANIEQKIRRPSWTTVVVLMIIAAAVGRWLADN